MRTPARPAPRTALRNRLLALCADDTTSGQEDSGLAGLRAQLEELRAAIRLQTIAPGRTNVLATWGRPRVLFSTHLDTVPPYLPPRDDGDVVRGRGSCDAKGQIVAQLAAIEALLHAGHRDLAWLGVVGEETDSIGAIRAQELAPELTGIEIVIDGEPTQNRLATGQRGIVDVELRCRGVAAHSGTPELGRSAIWELVDWLSRVRGMTQRVDGELGPEVFNVGRIGGGEALNVLPTDAWARLFTRSLPGSSFVDDVRRLAPDDGTVRVVHETPPDRFPAIDGFARAPVTFGSDAPRLRGLARERRVALVGPGSIAVAHTVDEHLALPELESGITLCIELAHRFLREPAPPSP
ncbi:MAG: M20/M25/M40 family metallo-hydrolase [Planctomycetes bacterium]|nr:M20/M25/M40 family metallo-hydrolase [Planctomycetota bacterium]